MEAPFGKTVTYACFFWFRINYADGQSSRLFSQFKIVALKGENFDGILDSARTELEVMAQYGNWKDYGITGFKAESENG